MPKNRVTPTMMFDQLPANLTVADIQTWLPCGRSKAYELMARFGIKVGAGNRLPKERLRDHVLLERAYRPVRVIRQPGSRTEQATTTEATEAMAPDGCPGVRTEQRAGPGGGTRRANVIEVEVR